jgi:hypothetical protein
MKKEIQIEIPSPCSADWGSMRRNETGRHCSSCDKTVVDFTEMSTQDIQRYFTANAGKKTCGHFYKGQLTNEKNRFQTVVFNLYCNSSLRIKNKMLRFAVLLLLGGLLSVTGCNSPTTGEVIEHHERITGDSIFIAPSDTLGTDSTVVKQKAN